MYQTELGHGADRSEFLRKHKIDTFLVCPKDNGTPMELTERTKTVKAGRTWNPELPFGNITDMNCVGSRQEVLQDGKESYIVLSDSILIQVQRSLWVVFFPLCFPVFFNE